MAQAFSSFDTYLAPFVKKDNLSYKQVKQCIQSFIFGVNTPSRWGCEKITTQVMTPNGFKNYSDLKVGDIIYTWVNGTLHEAPIKNLVYRKNNYGVLHQYKGTSYRQTVTPEHRCIIETNDGKYFVAEQSMNIFNKRKDVRFPTGIVDADCDNVSCLNDNEVVLAAMYYADDNGWTDNSRVPDKIANAREKEYMKSLIGNKSKINDVFLHMNKHQSQLFLKTWASFGGDEEKLMCRYDKNGTRDALHLIMLRAGYISYVCSTKRGADETPANYVAADFRKTVVASEQNEIPYDGYVWCPNTNDGTAIYRDEDGYIFISGNCQSPFTNITLDWVVPPDMADMPCLIGGKEMDFTYSDCKKEMDMVNKAFIETMLEGDSNGRGFQYPIPTYSITKDFDWSETENNKLLFEMTAKYGTPYFSNYINSDMEPSDVRSMCCRLRLDLRELRRKSGGFFGSGESTGCYDDQTEILTDNRGWIYFKDLTMDDVVLTRNSQGIIEKYHPTQLFKYPYNGKLYHFKNSRFDMMVTPNHKMVYCDKHTNAQKFVRADEYSFAKHPIPGTAQYSVPDIEYFELPKIEHEWNSGNHNSNMTKMWPPVNVKMDDWLRFLGWYLSKGSCDNENIAPSHGYRVVISEFKPDNVLSIEKLLSHLPFNYTKTENEFVICNKQLWNYCKQFGNYYNKFIPREILSNCSLRQLNILLDTMIAGNGSINTNSGQKTYYTSSRRLANDFQELCLKCGFSTNIKKRQPRNCCIYGRTYTKEQCSICYEMTITQNKSYYIMKENVNQVDYKGFVYCCEVPNHTLMVRRNGKATWCGNSVGVVTINMPQIAYLSKNEDEFFARLDRLMDISARSLDVKRRTITKLMEEGLYPYTKRYLGSFNNHFSTIGLIGMNEVGLNAAWLKKDMTHPETQEFSKKVLNHMRKRLADYQEKYGDLFNLEATPAESTTYRFAKHDVETYPDIITAAPKGEDVFYTNSSHLSVGFTSDIFDALDIQDELQTLYTSGTVFHAFLGEKLPDWKAAASLVKKIAENYKLPYYTMSPIYSICKNHGYLLGEQTKCPHCGGITEIYSRITGYYRPVQNWNVGKTQEYKERKLYDIGNSCLKKDNSTTFTEIKDQTKKISREETDARIIDEPQTEENKDSDAKILLYATGTCPKCRIAMKLLNDAHVEYKKILVEENLEEARRLDLKQAPSLVINGNVYAGLEEIKKAIQNLSK